MEAFAKAMETETKSDQDGDSKDKKDEDEDMSLDWELCVTGELIYPLFCICRLKKWLMW